MPDCRPILVYKEHEARHGDGLEYLDAKNKTLFASQCPYCFIDCILLRDEVVYYRAEQRDRLAVCPRCGWWSCESDQLADIGGGSSFFLSARSILKRFTVSSPDASIPELSRYMEAHSRQRGDIDPVKFEELVAAVYRDMLGYGIEICSYNRPDRGVDIVCIRTDDDFVQAIQVKRCNQSIKLGQIHQFFGAMVDRGHKTGIFVTASIFRKEEHEVGNHWEEVSGIEIDLVDGRRLMDFLGVLNKRNNKIFCPYWQQHGSEQTFGADNGWIELPADWAAPYKRDWCRKNI